MPKKEFEIDIESLKIRMNQTKDKAEFRRLQCLFLRATQPKMTAEQISKIVGLSIRRVWGIHSQYIHNKSIEDFKEKRGGRLRANLTIEEEKELLKPFFEKALESQIIEAGAIKEAYEKKIGRKVFKSTIYRMLARHGWRKIVPYKRHPKANKEEQENFKKTFEE